MSVGESICRGVCFLLLWCIGPVRAVPDATAADSSTPPAQANARQVSISFSFVRTFSSADEVRRPQHPILDRAFDIVAGAADPVARVDVLQSPSAVTTDSRHRVFVADPAAGGVHVFDFVGSRYGLLDPDGKHLHSPIALAADARDNLYVIDQGTKSIVIYDSKGKFQGYLGKLKGGESYFDSPVAIAIDRSKDHAYVCDARRNSVFVMDEQGRLIRRIGKRVGGGGPGEFRKPSVVGVSGGELFVLDAGNARIQIFDTAGYFKRSMNLGFADGNTGMAVDNAGNIYVSDPALNRIDVFRRDGKSLYAFDPSTIKAENFSHPSAMWVDAGQFLFVVDSDSNRIGEFQISAEKTQ